VARVEKKARLERRILVFIDEAGFYLLPAIAKTYAPCGETPVLRVPCTYDHLSVMSGVTLQGQLFTLVRTEALTGLESVQFLKHIQYQVGVKLLAIWDGSPIHRSAAVKSFLADGGTATIHLEQLPPYAPDLNPDEGVWHLLKDVELRNLCCSDLVHLQYEFGLAIRRLRRQPHLLRTCFSGAGLELDQV
jgi:transposase